MKEDPEGKDNLEKIVVKQLWISGNPLSPIQIVVITKERDEWYID